MHVDVLLAACKLRQHGLPNGTFTKYFSYGLFVSSGVRQIMTVKWRSELFIISTMQYIKLNCSNYYMDSTASWVPRNPWYTQALKKLTLAKRHLEHIWSRTHSFEDHKNLRSATNHYHAAIIKAKWTYNSSLISSNSTNPRQLWSTLEKYQYTSSSQFFISSTLLWLSKSLVSVFC